VPEEKRAFLTAVNVDMFNRRAILGASQRTKDGVVRTNTVLTW